MNKPSVSWNPCRCCWPVAVCTDMTSCGAHSVHVYDHGLSCWLIKGGNVDKELSWCMVQKEIPTKITKKTIMPDAVTSVKVFEVWSCSLWLLYWKSCEQNWKLIYKEGKYRVTCTFNVIIDIQSGFSIAGVWASKRPKISAQTPKF